MKSQTELFEISKKIVPGGVHSPVRSFKGLQSTPRFIERGDGAYIYDTEGKEYIDFCMSFGPLILGHNDKDVKYELKKALDRGWSYGTCEPYSVELAKYLTENIPFIDQIRFVNSGTEAVMTALRLARGVTGKNKIIKFNGCYHGHSDSMLIKAGSGLAGTSEASSKGITPNMAEDTLILELGDLKNVKECFSSFKDQIAAIIIEPLPANNGLLPQSLNFLKGLKDLTLENNALLIFDEVISGFRVGFEGMAKITGITPDIVTYGKIIGGGLPVGAIGANKEIMEHLAPVGDVYQAGTLSANPLAMVGGLATLKKLNNDCYNVIKKNSKDIIDLFNKWFATYENGRFKDLNIVSFESLFWITPTDQTISNINQMPDNLMEKFIPLFEIFLSKGIYLSPNAYEVGFVSLAHDANIIRDLKKRLFD